MLSFHDRLHIIGSPVNGNLTPSMHGAVTSQKMLANRVGKCTLKRWERERRNKKQTTTHKIGSGTQDIHEVVDHHKITRGDLLLGFPRK